MTGAFDSVVTGAPTNPSFSSRRKATDDLPAFSIPPRSQEIPSMSSFDSRNLSTIAPQIPSPRRPVTSQLTPESEGTGDGISPGLASIPTSSSQGSQPQQSSQSQYTFNHSVQNPAHAHGSWPTPQGYMNPISTAPRPQQHALAQPQSIPSQGIHSAYTPRAPVFGQNHPGGFRDTQSPATGSEGLPPPGAAYDHIQQPFHPHSINSAGAHPAGMHAQHPPTPSSTSGQIDPFSQSRPTESSYQVSSAAQSQGYGSYAPGHPSPPGHSPNGFRGQMPLPGVASYGRFSPQYPAMSNQLNGSVMSNIHQPGAQLSMMPPGMGMGHQYGQPMVYHQQQQAPPQDRPFKCDQCNQSFSRNHDLKRHKRIHLAIKPFPCGHCSKSFSRKDALKRHRLVKGCEAKAKANATQKSDRDDNDASPEPETGRGN